LRLDLRLQLFASPQWRIEGVVTSPGGMFL